MKYLSFLLIVFSATRISLENSRFYFVVWNVGQGQWTTFIENDRCSHFDIGGEFFPWQKAKKFCAGKDNEVYLSHWDWDHIGGLQKASRYLSKLCLFKRPLGKTNPRKQALLPQKICAPRGNIYTWSPAGGADTNSLSRVYSFQRILVPGDSPSRQEKIWSQQSEIQNARVLVLGHHGSLTSTSKELIGRLSHLKQAVASARWVRYHHPHPKTLSLLKIKKIPVLRTQDWGNIWFEQ